MLFESRSYALATSNVFLNLVVSSNELRHQGDDILQKVSRYGHYSFQRIAEYDVSLKQRLASSVTLYASDLRTGDILTPPIETWTFRAKTLDSAAAPTVDFPRAHI